MDKIFDEFLNSLVTKCMSNPALAGKQTELETHFQQLMLKTLVDQLTAEQFNQIKDLEPDSEEALDKLQAFAIQTPNFVDLIDQKLNAEADNISKSGVIPSN